MSKTVGESSRFHIFRGAAAKSLEESGVALARPSPAGPSKAGAARAQLAPIADRGNRTRVLFAGNGMSLVHLWYKSGFMLPRHTHDCDCLYLVVGGSLKLGTETLVTGDGFFVGSEVPYTYTAGERGVAVLEFRATAAFHTDLMVANPAFWDKLSETMRGRQAAWQDEREPPVDLHMLADADVLNGE